MTVTRAYRGRSADQRRAERRGRLLTAGFETWGEHGWAAVTVRGVCARAGLTVRYFYESFADRDALLLAVFDHRRDEVIAAIRQAATAAPEGGEARLRAGLAVLVNTLAADPRIARIALAEPAGSAALERRRRQTAAIFARLLADQVLARRGEAGDSADVRRVALFCVGGIEELLTAWLGGDLEITAGELIDDFVRLCTTASPSHGRVTLIGR